MDHRSQTLALLFLAIASLTPPATGAETDASPAVDSHVAFAAPRERRAATTRRMQGALHLDSSVALATTPRTVPFFQDSFVSGGQTYQYLMVGTNPKLTGGTTVVRNTIVPLRFVFADGRVFDPSRTIRPLRRSPLFQSTPFTSGLTQYGDAIQRAEFWTYTQNTSYHVLLHRPRVTRTAVIHVPAAEGGTAMSHAGGMIGVVSEAFFAQQLVPAILTQLKILPTTLAILWSYNVDLQTQPGAATAILGEHSADTNQTGTKVWTWAWASWHTPDTAPSGSTDVAILSHEIAEWYNDPFGTNSVPPWQAPLDVSCNALLEVGDPVSTITFSENGYHLQDEVFFSWFAHQTPSIGMGGMYTYLGTFTGPPPICSGS